MDKSKIIEFLQGILESTKSIDENKIVRPHTESKIDDLPKDRFTNGKVESSTTYFLYELRRENDAKNELPEYNFTVELYRMRNNYWFKNWNDDKSFYCARVKIGQKNTWGNSYSTSETYFVDVDREPYTLPLLKDMWHFLNNKENTRLHEEENKKINLYLKEIKRMTSKSVVRDEKLDKLLK